MDNVLIEQPLLIIGGILGIGYFFARVFKIFRFPNVITYIIVGFFLSNFVVKDMIDPETLKFWFTISEELALGLIGFEIGTELKLSKLKENPKMLSIILFAEVIGAFVLIFVLIFTFSQNFLLAFVLGGIGTATAPAATIEIIRRARATGEVTTMLQWVLAFDDVIAVVFVEGILAYLLTLVHGGFSIGGYFVELMHELGYALLLGLAIGFVLDYFIENYISDELEMMEFTLGFIVAGIGIAVYLHTSVITTTMVMGAIATNMGGDNYATVKDLLEFTMSPVIAIFFVLVGAQVFLSDFFPFPWLAFLYLIGRTVGKISGSFFGAHQAGTSDTMKQNLGLGLLAQGGVALGLVSEAQRILSESTDSELIDLGHLLVSTVIISTIFSEALGSVGTLFGLKRADEVGKAPQKITKRATFMHE